MSGAYHGKMQLSAEQQGTLGMTFCALPPGPLVLNSVLEGTWAEKRGLKAGDVVLAVNGSSPSDMSRTDFMVSMGQRPVVLTFDLPAMDVVEDEIPKPREEVGEQEQKKPAEECAQDQRCTEEATKEKTTPSADITESIPATESVNHKDAEKEPTIVKEAIQPKEEVAPATVESVAAVEKAEAASPPLPEGGKPSKNKKKKNKAGKVNDAAIGA